MYDTLYLHTHHKSILYEYMIIYSWYNYRASKTYNKIIIPRYDVY